MRDHEYFVYIMASKSRVLYTGMTNNLSARVLEHKTEQLGGFTKRYRVHRLVYFESYNYVQTAISREKEIKRWIRQRRVALIESTNPTWEDLAGDWFTPERLRKPRSLIHVPSSIEDFLSPQKEPRRPQIQKTVSKEAIRLQFRPSRVQSFTGGPKPREVKPKE